MKNLFLIIVFNLSCLMSFSQSVTELNKYLTTYSHNIQTNNPYNQNSSSCIYKANYMNAQIQGKTLELSFGFGWDEKYGYIQKCVLKIDLSTATFYTGYWSKNYYSKKWEQNGSKEILTIKDENGMELFSTGQQSYNQGTKQDLIPEIKISFGTVPIANKIINEIYSIQEKYKAQEAWLLPEPEPKEVEKTAPTSTNKTTNSGVKNVNETKGSIPKKVGKYVQ